MRGSNRGLPERVATCGGRRPGRGAMLVALALGLLAGGLATPVGAQYPLRVPPPPNTAVTPHEFREVPADSVMPSAPAVFSTTGDLPQLREVLAQAAARYRLRLTLLSRDIVEGHPLACRGDTLWLVPPGYYHARRGPLPDARRHLVPVFVPDIVRLQQRRPGTDRGGEIGATSGVVVGGVFGLLVGLWVSGWNGEDGNDFAAIAGCMMGGASVTAMAGSLVGSGLGATGHVWYALWPTDELAPDRLTRQEAARLAATDAPPSLTRVLAEAGYAASGDPYRQSGSTLGLGLLGVPGTHLELGPVIRFQALGGVADVPPALGTDDFTKLEPIITFGLDARLGRRERGWRPWFEGGVGLSLASELYPSAHAGLGLRLRTERDFEIGAVARRYFMLNDVPDAVHGYWTIGLVVSIVP